MATEAGWKTAFDMIGLAAYLTLMTGELPERSLLSAARLGSGPRPVALPEKRPKTSKRRRRRSSQKAAA